MSDTDYLLGRKQFSRPQGMLLANNPGTVDSNGFRIPDGYEVGADTTESPSFIILSDDNRGPISIKKERIEERRRTINGSMRSYHIADKVQISTSWSMLPSRSFSLDPNFSVSTGKPTSLVTSINHDGLPLTPEKTVTPYGSAYNRDQKYTSDGGAGGVEMLDWYENNKGSFWVYLSYDKYNEFEATTNKYQNLNKYSQVIEVYFSDFGYSVEKRGASNFDFWNINFTLEEV